MAIEDRTRHDRLRGLLPRAYATDPVDSALGVILEVLGDLLRDADRDAERALRDRWLTTATGARAAPIETPDQTPDAPGLPTIDLAGAPLPLELLGAALDLVRQPWDVDHEAYRTRVRVLGPMLARGLSTPRVVLAFALSALASEPCPVLERQGEETRGRGLPPGSLARCDACRGGRVTPPPGTPCPLRHSTIVDASLSDNPRMQAELRRRGLDPLTGAAAAAGAPIRVHSDSLFSARPTIVLRVPADAAGSGKVIACLRSLDTGEELIVAHPLAAGETLTIYPASPHQPGTPRHQQEWVDPLPGDARTASRAHVATAGGLVDLAGRVLFRAASPASPASTASPAAIEARIDSPALPPDGSTWIYRPLGKAELAEALADAGGAIDDIDTLLDQAPAQPWPVPVDLTLRWWTRPPARFRLRIQRSPAVMTALTTGAGDYLRRMVDRVRAAGVYPVIDFVDAPIRESLDPGDRLIAAGVGIREALAPADRDGFTDLAITLPAEALAPADRLCFIGNFDVTRFDFSCFAAVTPGRFDTTFFDDSAAQTGELGAFDRSSFDDCVAHAVAPGVFDLAYFDDALACALSREPAVLDATYFDEAQLAP